MELLGVVIALMAMREGLILCEDEDKSSWPSLQKINNGWVELSTSALLNLISSQQLLADTTYWPGVNTIPSMSHSFSLFVFFPCVMALNFVWYFILKVLHMCVMSHFTFPVPFSPVPLSALTLMVVVPPHHHHHHIFDLRILLLPQLDFICLSQNWYLVLTDLGLGTPWAYFLFVCSLINV